MCDQQSLRSACTYVQSDQSLCLSLEYSMSVKLLTEHHLEFLSLKGGCTGSFESIVVKMPHCWKSHVVAHLSSASVMTGTFSPCLFQYECRPDSGLTIFVMNQPYQCNWAGETISIQYTDNWLHVGNITCPACQEICQVGL